MGKEKAVKFLKLNDTISVICENCNINDDALQDIVHKYGSLLPCGKCITNREFSELITRHCSSEKNLSVLTDILIKAV